MYATRKPLKMVLRRWRDHVFKMCWLSIPVLLSRVREAYSMKWYAFWFILLNFKGNTIWKMGWDFRGDAFHEPLISLRKSLVKRPDKILFIRLVHCHPSSLSVKEVVLFVNEGSRSWSGELFDRATHHVHVKNPVMADAWNGFPRVYQCEIGREEW